MGLQYKAIAWNRQKRRYDRIMLGFILGYLLIFSVGNIILQPGITPPTLIIRATATLALVMLHIILMIGPLARLDDRFLPLLYNRRHLGVSMFLIAAIHGIFSIIQFHTLGNLNPIVSVFVSNSSYGSLSQFPFQSLGFMALIILFLMAATSHDFWLHQLSPKFWKAMHMMVYVAYGLIIMHVMLGVVQSEGSSITVGLMGLGMLAIIALHLTAGFKQKAKDSDKNSDSVEAYVLVGDINEIPDRRAKMLVAEGENIAVFKYDGKVSAVNNVCKHQNGPLGEGKIVDSCIVCPWHGYEYQPEDGCAPAPFTEKVDTYQVKIIGTKVYVDPKPLGEGVHVEPAVFEPVA